MRGDEIDDIIWILEHVISGDEEVPTPPLPVSLIKAIIKHLRRVPRPRGRPKQLTGRALVARVTARAIALSRKRKIMAEARANGRGIKAIDAEWKAAEESVPVFKKLTGRTLSPTTILKIMQSKSRR